MTLVRWGIVPVCVLTALLGLLLFLLQGHWTFWVGLGIAVPLWLFTVAFFRNPHRRYDGPETDLLAPADGVVADTDIVFEPNYLDAPCRRIGIFMSVFDAHVNRSPGWGRVAHRRYRPGRFLDARHPDATRANESNELGLVLERGVPETRILVRQIAGLIARRIVCRAAVGDRISRGEMYGMIRFGSRLELLVPIDVAHNVLVSVGDRVQCGGSVLVRLATRAKPDQNIPESDPAN